jgi:hypothetical protein
VGVFDFHSARAKRSARRSSTDVAEFVKTGVAAFGLLEQGARALIPMTAAGRGLLRLPRFALGGLVEGLGRLALPMQPLRLAAGGPAVAGSILNLSIDGNRFPGLRAPEHTAQNLRTYAISRQTAATGRKPSWLR